MRTEDTDHEAQAEREERKSMTADVEPAVLEPKPQGLTAQHAVQRHDHSDDRPEPVGTQPGPAHIVEGTG